MEYFQSYEEIKKYKKEDFEPMWKEIDKKRNDGVEKGIELLRNSPDLTIAQIQRRFSIGYASASRLLDHLVAMGFVSESVQEKKRLINEEKRLEMEDYIRNWFASSYFYYPYKNGAFDYRDLLKNLNGFCIYQFSGDENDRHYDYSDYVFEIIDYVTEGKPLKDCLSRVPGIFKKDIDELTAEDIRYYFRYIEVVERITPGMIAKELKNANFVKMFEKYLELEITTTENWLNPLV